MHQCEAQFSNVSHIYLIWLFNFTFLLLFVLHYSVLPFKRIVSTRAVKHKAREPEFEP